MILSTLKQISEIENLISLKITWRDHTTVFYVTSYNVFNQLGRSKH